MTKITVRRFKSTDDATLSEICVDGKFFCFGLEDEHREEKIVGETRIPAGEYFIKLRDEGGMTKRYAKYPLHEGMLWLQDVPGFTYIYIHVGNTDDHTEGCLLVGNGARADQMTVMNSVDAYTSLYAKVLPAARSGALKIEYIDEDR